MKVPKRVIDSLRAQHESQPPEYDLCASFTGTYVDIVLDYKNEWHASIGQIDLGYFESREKAIEAIEEFRL